MHDVHWITHEEHATKFYVRSNEFEQFYNGIWITNIPQFEYFLAANIMEILFILRVAIAKVWKYLYTQWNIFEFHDILKRLILSSFGNAQTNIFTPFTLLRGWLSFDCTPFGGLHGYFQFCMNYSLLVLIFEVASMLHFNRVGLVWIIYRSAARARWTWWGGLPQLVASGHGWIGKVPGPRNAQELHPFKG